MTSLALMTSNKRLMSNSRSLSESCAMMSSWAVRMANQKEVLYWLNQKASPPDMVVTADPLLSYLVSTYSRVRSWAGYGAGTLDFSRKMSRVAPGVSIETILPQWAQMPVLYIQRKPQDASWQPPTMHTRSMRTPPSVFGRSCRIRHLNRQHLSFCRIPQLVRLGNQLRIGCQAGQDWPRRMTNSPKSP